MRISDWSFRRVLFRSKGFALFGRNEQHRCDLLQFDDDIIRVVAVDIGQRIVTGGAAFAVGRIEQINGLPVMGAKARARVVILAFYIEDDNRASPGDRKSTRLNSSH